MASLRDRFRFFHANAGGIVGEAAKGALALARAEIWREKQENKGKLRIEWEEDADADTSWMDEKELKRWRQGYCFFLSCIVSRKCKKCDRFVCEASLGGIHLTNSRSSDDYRRVVEAELALEMMPRKAGRNGR